MKIDTHLYLVSAQATPNLTPALDSSIAPKRIILLVSPGMQQRAKWLEDILKPRGIKIDRWPIDDAFDIEHLQYRVIELLVTKNKQVREKGIALNATGGTKPMSIAAYEVFRSEDLPIFYIHPERDRLIWLHPQKMPPIELADRIRLEALLRAYGAQVESIERDPIPHQFHKTTQQIVKGIHRYTEVLAQLNWAASTARRSDLVSRPLDQSQLDQRGFIDLVQLFAQSGLVQLEGNRIRFRDEDARFYVNGGWLEDYVFSLIAKMRSKYPAIQDVARSINVQRSTPSGDVPNEIDVALLVNNRLYIIECKTRQWNEKGTGANALYRLDTLKDLLGGLQAKAMLVSYRALKKYDRQRAGDLDIEVCAGTGLLNLGSMVEKWVR